MSEIRILLTGGTGFVGSHLVPLLKNYDYKIVVREISLKYPLEKQILYDIKLTDEFKKKVKEFNPSIVVHLASYLSSNDDSQSIIKIIDANILFTSILLESLKSTDLKTFVNTGSFSEYYLNDGFENPSYFYSASKIAIKPIIKYFKNLKNFKLINVVPYTIYGGLSRSKKVIDLLVESSLSVEPIDMTNGEQVLDFIHVKDVVEFYHECIINHEIISDNAVFHLGTGRGVSLRDISTILRDEFNIKVNVNWGALKYRELDIMKAVAPFNVYYNGLDWKPKITL